jgi:hypothetical protein
MLKYDERIFVPAAAVIQIIWVIIYNLNKLCKIEIIRMRVKLILFYFKFGFKKNFKRKGLDTLV